MSSFVIPTQSFSIKPPTISGTTSIESFIEKWNGRSDMHDGRFERELESTELLGGAFADYGKQIGD